jgi:transcription elongation GreA/GreB family factor
VKKHTVVKAIRAQLESELNGLIQMTAMSRDEATGGESKAENKYDTRALEASYLAAGQGQRLEDLRKLVGWYAAFQNARPFDRVSAGALVHIEDEEGLQKWLFVAPSGGNKVQVDAHVVHVISLHSPLGRALAGKQKDDASTVNSPRGLIEVEVLSVL